MRQTVSRWGTVVLAVLALASHSVAQPAVGADESEGEHLLIRVTGGVEVKRRDSSVFVPGHVGMGLHFGDLINVPESGEATVFCADTTQMPLPRGVNGIPCSPSAPVIVSFQGTPISSTRGTLTVGYPLLIMPRQTRVSGPRPLIRWREVPGVRVYRVILRGPGVSWSTTVSDVTSLQYPEDAPMLEVGPTYAITIEAGNRSSNEDGMPDRGFSMLDDASRAVLAGYVAAIEALDIEASEMALLRAKLYSNADFGLRSEAIQVLESAADGSGRPDVSRTLAELYLAIGLPQLAERHLLDTASRGAAIDDRDSEIWAHVTLGDLYEALSLFADARAQYEMALTIADGLGDDARSARLHEQLARLAAED